MASPKELLLGKRKSPAVPASSARPAVTLQTEDPDNLHADSPVTHHYGAAGAVGSEQEAELQRICRYLMTGEPPTNHQ